MSQLRAINPRRLEIDKNLTNPPKIGTKFPFLRINL
jgi:hypothetical protein